MAELDAAAKDTARELDIEPGWLNPHFETYTGVLPPTTQSACGASTAARRSSWTRSAPRTCSS